MATLSVLPHAHPQSFLTTRFWGLGTVGLGLGTTGFHSPPHCLFKSPLWHPSQWSSSLCQKAKHGTMGKKLKLGSEMWNSFSDLILVSDVLPSASKPLSLILFVMRNMGMFMISNRQYHWEDCQDRFPCAQSTGAFWRGMNGQQPPFWWHSSIC